MNRLLKRGFILSILLFLLLLNQECWADEDEDCDEFVLDPQDPRFCHGGDDPDNAPLDSNICFLMFAAGVLAARHVSKIKLNTH